MPSFFREWSAELKSRMSCPIKDGTTPPPWLPHLLLHLLLLTKVQCQQAVTMVEEVEEETTTFLPEQREVPFGFIYSKEFRVRVCYKANVINVCNYQNIMTNWSSQSKLIFVTTGAGGVLFLAVQDSSIGDIVSQWVTFWFQSRAEQSRAEHYNSNSTTIALQ